MKKQKKSTHFNPFAWWDNIAFFDAKHIDRHLGEVFAPYKKKIQVPVFSPFDLLSVEEIIQNNFLHIDAEGTDLENLRAWSFEKIELRSILVEYIHLTREERQLLQRSRKSRV